MNELAVKMYSSIVNGKKNNIGSLLPSIQELASNYDASEADVKQAIGDLIYEGVLDRDPSNREIVRVRNPYLWDLVTGNHSFTNEAKLRGQNPSNKVLTFERRKSWPQVQKRLQLNKNDEVFVLERLLFADDEKVGLEFSYMPAKLYEGVTREMFEGGGSTFKVMQKKFGLIPEKGVDELAVATLEKREAQLLGREEGEPVLIRFRVTLSPDKIPIKGSRAIYLFSPGYELNI